MLIRLTKTTWLNTAAIETISVAQDTITLTLLNDRLIHLTQPKEIEAFKRAVEPWGFIKKWFRRLKRFL